MRKWTITLTGENPDTDDTNRLEADAKAIGDFYLALRFAHGHEHVKCEWIYDPPEAPPPEVT